MCSCEVPHLEKENRLHYGTTKGLGGRRTIAIWGGLVIALAACYVQAGSGGELNVLVRVGQNEETLAAVWSLGADDIGRDGDGVAVRVSQEMLEAMDRANIAYEMVIPDLQAHHEQNRTSRLRRLDESFVGYHTWEETEAILGRFAAENPDIAALEVIGYSIEERPIYALRISDNAQQVEPDEPAMLIMGCHHAREWISVEIPLYFADRLIDNYRKDGDVTRLINYAEVWIVPVVNPDGFAYTQAVDDHEHRWWRKNRRNNGDGTMGVDPNRNYSVDFGGPGASGQPFSETYHGPSAFSEPESAAIRDLMMGSFGRSFGSSISYHNYSQIILYPYGYTLDPADNAADYDAITGEMSRLINDSHDDHAYDYAYGPGGRSLYIVSGDFVDWAYVEAGAYAMTIEVRPSGPPYYFELPEDQIIPTCEENWPAFMYYAEQTLIPFAWLLDGDLDGLVDFEDYCIDSPSAEIDEIGCTPEEQDLDGDGVANAADGCANSLPGQVVDELGCRVETFLTLRVTSNASGAEVNVDPADIDGLGEGIVGPEGITRAYAGEVAIALQAPESAGGATFKQWLVDGVPQAAGLLSIVIETEGDVTAEAVYIVPLRLEVVGPARIPDVRASGMAYLAKLSARVAYSDGSAELINPLDVVWAREGEGVGLLTSQGEFLAYDVSAEVGEQTVLITAEATVGDTVMRSAPLSLIVFDSATLEPYCLDVVIEGPAAVTGGQTATYHAKALFDGENVHTTTTETVYWAVASPDAEAAGSPVAEISAEGVLRADAVAEDTEVTIVAAIANDDGTARRAEKVILIRAAEAEAEQPVNGGGSIACGAVGLIGILGMFAGLVALRFSRR